MRPAGGQGHTQSPDESGSGLEGLTHGGESSEAP
eukprot:CAMPEP_0206033936 /NCGR_PEP_ID=MMETSP1466-20131121/1010_1 /ASSEMBLY_ACC=CAM_ASM_001126 /TAXON_ID=44452 /ORGANISM="Pavlova gyrans, Strain CCMP608" /LENGTH=33 /DNA_ID= /DNA_START= /DNA_END= /DNA_ORIENTATION=